jgi:hypothetical protein
MWYLILSCFRMYIFAPLVFVMAIVGILICMLTDLISLILKQFRVS